jgi:hypothetical protein
LGLGLPDPRAILAPVLAAAQQPTPVFMTPSPAAPTPQPIAAEAPAAVVVRATHNSFYIGARVSFGPGGFGGRRR